MDYQEQSLTGTKWRRCCVITIFNHRGEVPSISFQEEDVYSAGGFEMKQPSGILNEVFDPAKIIEIVDPDTLEPTTNTITYGEVYGILLSAYLKVARARDALRNE